MWLQGKSLYYIVLLGVVVQSTISVDPVELTIVEATESRGAKSRQHTFHADNSLNIFNSYPSELKDRKAFSAAIFLDLFRFAQILQGFPPYLIMGRRQKEGNRCQENL